MNAGKINLKAPIIAALVVAMAALAAISPPARAHDHQIPQTTLKKGTKELQAGIRVVESNWVYPTGDGLCADENATYEWRFPQTDRVAAGSDLRVRIFKAQRPDSFRVVTYRALDSKGVPSGEGRPLERILKRVTRDGKTVAWDVVFPVNRANTNYYLVADGHWQDREGCGGADQYAFWSFHAKTRA